MPGFRWELQQDIALVSEVATSRPQKLQDWDEIAVTLSAAFSSDEKPVQLKARGCRERMDLLLKKYKDEDIKSLKSKQMCSLSCVHVVML